VKEDLTKSIRMVGKCRRWQIYTPHQAAVAAAAAEAAQVVISSAVASPLTTNHAAKGSVFVNLKTQRQLNNCLLRTIQRKAPCLST
jgi:hypothetical protein